MAEEKKPGSGALFVNNRKKESKHPDFTGTLIGLDGKTYWISAWNKIAKRDGSQFFSLAIEEQKEKP
jgi:uncharacterized protein (DUF736 family)